MEHNQPLNSQAINQRDDFFIVNSSNNSVCESHASIHAAEHAAHILNAHEVKNSRDPVYIVVSRKGI